MASLLSVVAYSSTQVMLFYQLHYGHFLRGNDYSVDDLNICFSPLLSMYVDDIITALGTS